MARTSRTAAREPRTGARRTGGGFLLGVFVGLLIGLGTAVGVAFYLNKTPIPFASRAQPVAKDPGTAPTIAGLPQASKSGAPLPGGAPVEKPQFDFYKILPGGEEPVSDKELRERASAAAPGTRDVYYVQAGSFQNPVDADNQKARLAIVGLESSVEPTTVPDRGTWYRVRLGPYSRLDELNRVRQTLSENGIEAGLVRLKGAAPKKSN